MDLATPKFLAHFAFLAGLALAILLFAATAPLSRTAPPPADVDPNGPRETAIFAGGCFWGMEDLLRQIPGVVDTEVGYTGGTFDHPRYSDVSSGKTGHAEAVKVVFDPSKLSYATLLDRYFAMHDPTTVDRQGNDVGTQYRSAIFYTSDAQRQTAEEVKAQVDQSGKWPRPLVTHIVPAGTFWSAEEYHQDYLVKHPHGYQDHYYRY